MITLRYISARGPERHLPPACRVEAFFHLALGHQMSVASGVSHSAQPCVKRTNRLAANPGHYETVTFGE